MNQHVPTGRSQCIFYSGELGWVKFELVCDFETRALLRSWPGCAAMLYLLVLKQRTGLLWLPQYVSQLMGCLW